ncbi:MAG: hypothetical protein H0X47_06295 [Nitrospirales bacterium]|nr:hypothetical protein [Nitrospirales bacterium]
MSEPTRVRYRQRLLKAMINIEWPITRFAGVAPYQDGGLATRVYEHGDSGNGDSLYPKTWLYLAGWGKADVLKNGHLLFQDYAAHFMVMERSRDPNTHEVPYPLKRSLPGGETDPAGLESISGYGLRRPIPRTFFHLKRLSIYFGKK